MKLLSNIRSANQIEELEKLMVVFLHFSHSSNLSFGFCIYHLVNLGFLITDLESLLFLNGNQMAANLSTSNADPVKYQSSAGENRSGTFDMKFLINHIKQYLNNLAPLKLYPDSDKVSRYFLTSKARSRSFSK